MIYVASPYSKHPRGVEQAYREALVVTAYLVEREGSNVFSPIVHCHPLANIMKDCPRDFSYWQDYNRSMIERCDSLLVAMLDGWAESEGVSAEISHARALNKIVSFFGVTEIRDFEMRVARAA
jgi:hypothetical protein